MGVSRCICSSSVATCYTQTPCPALHKRPGEVQSYGHPGATFTHVPPSKRILLKNHQISNKKRWQVKIWDFQQIMQSFHKRHPPLIFWKCEVWMCQQFIPKTSNKKLVPQNYATPTSQCWVTLYPSYLANVAQLLQDLPFLHSLVRWS